MASPKSRLGRGLGGIISGGGAKKGAAKKATAKPAVSASKKAEPAPPKKKEEPAGPYREIAVSAIEPNPYQPRREMDPEHVAELAASIASEGLLQPIVVRESSKGKYELIAGERRWRAHQKLGLKAISARVMAASDTSSAVISLIENLQREGLNPIEEALGYASLMKDFDLTQEAVSQRIGRPRASIANTLRLLALDREIQGYLAKGMLSTGHAKVLLGVEDPSQRLLLARRILESGMSVRDAERQVKRIKSEASLRGENRDAQGAEDTVVRDLEKQLSSQLNTKVHLKHTPKKGRIIIEYFGNEDLQRILERTGLQ
ncbi:MAG: ParB/RepB/Spo0J family partition protein [Verrucomicrobiota bacterium]